MHVADAFLAVDVFATMHHDPVLFQMAAGLAVELALAFFAIAPAC